jgi:hypothetical protein
VLKFFLNRRKITIFMSKNGPKKRGSLMAEPFAHVGVRQRRLV